MTRKGKITVSKASYYAQSILDIATANGNDIDQVENEFRELKEEITSNLKLKNYLSDPSIEEAERIKTGFKILSKSITTAVKAVLTLIVTMNVVENIGQIYDSFIELINKLRKQAYAEVVSCIELDSRSISVIKKIIDKSTGLDVRVKNVIDKSIIGGIVIRIGEEILDLSIKNKLDDMKTRLKSIELKGEDFGIKN